MPRVDYNQSLTGMKEIDSNAIRRLIVEEAVGGDTRGKWPFAWSLAASSEPFPCACINFPHTSWSMSRGEVAELKRAMEQDPAYIACKNEIVSITLIIFGGILWLLGYQSSHRLVFCFEAGCGCTLEFCRIGQAW